MTGDQVSTRWSVNFYHRASQWAQRRRAHEGEQKEQKTFHYGKVTDFTILLNCSMLYNEDGEGSTAKPGQYPVFLQYSI